MCCFLNQGDAELLLELARQHSAEAHFDKLDENVVRKLSLCASGSLAPINAFIGGLAAQEVMKVRKMLVSDDHDLIFCSFVKLLF